MDVKDLAVGYKVPVYNPENRHEIIKCEILAINEENNTFYVHYTNLNRRYDVWVNEADFILTNDQEIEAPKKKKKTEEKKLQSVIEEETKVRNFSTITINGYQINTWYFSPYPKDIAKNGNVFLCDYCLYYFSTEDTLITHSKICHLRSPPGLMIYNDTEKDIAIFEVDGYKQVNYCRNIALLSKLFLDHKSLIYDVDAFLFYVLCKKVYLDENKEIFTWNMVGYFSKEKVSEMGYNLACILTLPCEQRNGYGKILIDFSYMLSKRDKLISGPEKPLSDLGLLGYRSYWLEVILECVKETNELNVKEMSGLTHIAEDDILGTLIANKMIKYHQDSLIITLNEKCKKRMDAGRSHRVYEKYLIEKKY